MTQASQNTFPRRRLRRLGPTPSIGARSVSTTAVSGLGVVVGAKVYPLSSREVVLGSCDRSDIVLPQRHVSARHCALSVRPGGVRVRDLRSTNRLWYRGAAVDDVVLKPGEALLVARQPLLVVRIGVGYCRDAIDWGGVVSRDPVSLASLGECVLAGSADAPTWIFGESGTGKEGAAWAIHRSSPRADGPFVPLNCAALPDALAEAELFGVTKGAFTGADRDRRGAFQRAHGGTLLLDEVGELSSAVQAKLLRVLESGRVSPVGAERSVKVDVRVIVSTWRDLGVSAASGDFRFDLLQRLWVLRVTMPPLRDRLGDIEALIAHFLTQDPDPGLIPDPGLLATLRRASWPGNVRQLSNQVRRAMIVGQPWQMLPDDLKATRGHLPRRGKIADAAVIALIESALVRARGSRTHAARELGISRSTLYRWLRRAEKGDELGSVTSLNGSVA